MKKESHPKKKEKNKESTLNRRDFLRLGAAGAAIGAIALPGKARENAISGINKKASNLKVVKHEDFPIPIRSDYKPIAAYNLYFSHAFFGPQLKAMGLKVDPETMQDGKRFLEQVNYHHDNNKKGFSQKSKAIMAGGWALSNKAVGPVPAGVPDFGLFRWKNPMKKDPRALLFHDFVDEEKYQFETKRDAANTIKRAAKLYGADLVGITKRDPKWDYSVQFSPVPPAGRDLYPMPPRTVEEFKKMQEMVKNWSPDQFTFGMDKLDFEPKSVIVLAFEMDYEAMSASPTEVSAAAAGEGYSKLAKVAYQVAVMLRQLGYKALPTGNDTGMSIPYAIAAGLGEGTRMGPIITYKYGPRVRLAKVYTELDFIEYDKPKTFGVYEFCKKCKRCAESCPSGAISFDDEPSFEPTHENKDNSYWNAPGTKKWYLDAKKCFGYWSQIGADCANCITSCPYNKPDFWHHKLITKISAGAPGPVHSLMTEMDKAFGYGNVNDKEAVDKFYSPKGKSYDGY